MTTRYFLGQAKQVVQVNTVTIANSWATNDTITITVAGIDFLVTIGALVTTAQVAVTLKEAFNGEELTDTTASSSPTHAQGGGVAIPQLSRITATVSGSVVTLTADDEGVPFMITVTENTAGSGTATGAVGTAATGKWFWSDADNWTGATVPVNGDDVIIDRALPILYGLDQSAVTLATLTVLGTFSGPDAVIGLPRWNLAGYAEYRDDHLKIGATSVRIGVGDGSGSGRIKINFGSVQMTTEVQKTGQPLETDGTPAVLLQGTHASNAADVQAGSVGFGFFAEATTLLTLRTAAQANVICGTGCTLGTLTGEGQLRVNSNVTTMNQNGGTWTISEAATIGTLNQKNGATLKHRSSGTISTANIGGLVDCSDDASARTITTATINARGRIVDPNQTITYTNAVARGTDVREISAA
jgi:hypothetical protein